jgi:hypothetical protein
MEDHEIIHGAVHFLKIDFHWPRLVHSKQHGNGISVERPPVLMR